MHQRFFAKDPCSTRDRWWYQHSSLWRRWGVPLVSMESYEDLRDVEREFKENFWWLLVCCSLVMILPLLPVALKKENLPPRPKWALPLNFGTLVPLVGGMIAFLSTTQNQNLKIYLLLYLVYPSLIFYAVVLLWFSHKTLRSNRSPLTELSKFWSHGEEEQFSAIFRNSSTTKAQRPSALRRLFYLKPHQPEAIEISSVASPTHSASDAENPCYQFALSGHIDVDDVFMLILAFISADIQTLFSISSVSCAWRERANHMAQWAMLPIQKRTIVVKVDVAETTTLVSNFESVAHSREQLLYNQVAREKAMGVLWRGKLKWIVFTFWFMVIPAPALATGYVIGYLPNNGIEGDVAVGATSGIVGFFMWLLFVAPVLRWIDLRYPAYLPVRIVDTLISQGVLAVPLFIIGTVLLALLGARQQALHQLNDMPTLNLTCNTAANHTRTVVDNIMPAQVFLPNTSLFHVVGSSRFQTSTNVTISYLLLAASTLPAHSRCPNNRNQTTMIALSLPMPNTEVDYKWPPKNGSAFFRTPTNQKYFSMDPNGAVDRLWYEESPMWRNHGIPLVTKNNYDNLSDVQEDYGDYVTFVCLCCFSLSVVPVMRGVVFERCKHLTHVYSYITIAYLLLVFSPLTMALFGGICFWLSEDWCMIGHTPSFVLFVTGIAPSLLIPIVFVLFKRCAR